MEWLKVTVRLYAEAFTRGARLALTNWPVLGTVFVYSTILLVGVQIAAPLGIFGGFLLSFLWAACVSSFLALVETMIRTSRVSFEDFRHSFGAHLWDVIGVTFVFWLFFQFATPAILQLQQGVVILLCIQLAFFVFFNAVPELIYLGHFSVLDLLRESYAFISENWIEWFPANLVMAAILVGLSAAPSPGFLQIAQDAVIALLAYYAMVVRGLLFIELQGSSRRSRSFRYRAR